MVFDEKEFDEEGDKFADLHAYLDKLYTLMLAYARAGAQRTDTQPTESESKTSDAALYVKVPLDTMLRYHNRAGRSTSKLPQNMALAWVIVRDEEERAIWIDRVKHTTKDLGTIVEEVMTQREAVWMVDNALARSSEPQRENRKLENRESERIPANSRRVEEPIPAPITRRRSGRRELQIR